MDTGFDNQVTAWGELYARAVEECIATLPTEDQEVARKYLAMYDPEDQMAAVDGWMGNTWKEQPVDIPTFLFDKNYLGLTDGQSRPQIYPKLVEDLDELFKGAYTEAIFTGGIGYGKSTIAELCLARMAYELGCLSNPARAYGLRDVSKIVLINVAINKRNAANVVFSRVCGMLDNSPWFQRNMKRVRDVEEHLEFANGVWLAPFAADEKAVVGFDAFGGVMDEVNDMALMLESARKKRGEVVYDQAQTLRDAILRRMESRFTIVGSKLPGILVQISSSKYPGEYTERRIAEAKQQITDTGKTNIFWLIYSSWDTNRQRYSPTTFKLAIPTTSAAPKIIENEKDMETAVANQQEVIDVPDNLRTHFTTDIYSAIRDFVGRSTSALTPFILRTDKIFEAIQRGKAAGLDHPFSSVEVTNVDNALIMESFMKRVDPSKAYYAHGDLAKGKIGGDKAGIAIGHIAGYRTITQVKDGREVTTALPHIVIDLMIRIIAPPGDEIHISSVKNFFKMIAMAGVKFNAITFDQWQSLSLIQDLTQAGVASIVEELSVDRTPEPYTELKSAIYEDRFDMYEYGIVLQELAGLERNEKTGKIDHRPNGSKDVADCLAAIVFKMVEYVPTERPLMVKAWESPTGNAAYDRANAVRNFVARQQGVAPEAAKVSIEDQLFSPGFEDDE